MKPPVSYYGGKMRMAPWIASLLPPHRVYLEPFFGSGAVLFAKRPVTHEIVNDVDGNVVNFFKVLRDQPADFLSACELTPYAKDEFRGAVIAGQEIDDVERARRWWVRCQQGFNQCATESSRSSWATSSARGSNMATSQRRSLQRFMPAAARLAEVSIENDDACVFIERYAREQTVIYADPPYDPDSRTRGGANDYEHEFSADDHRRLSETLHSTAALVVLSGYHSDLYDDLYGDWPRLERRMHKPASNHGDKDRRSAVEVLWSNRALNGADRLPLFGPAASEALSGVCR